MELLLLQNQGYSWCSRSCYRRILISLFFDIYSVLFCLRLILFLYFCQLLFLVGIGTINHFSLFLNLGLNNLWIGLMTMTLFNYYNVFLAGISVNPLSRFLNCYHIVNIWIDYLVHNFLFLILLTALCDRGLL